MQVALAAAVIAVVLGTLASMALVRYDFFGRDAVSLLVLLPIALPGIVTGIALNTLFTQAPGRADVLHAGRRARHVLHRHRGQQRLGAAAADVGSTAEEASMDLGATPWTTWWLVTFPALRGALLGRRAAGVRAVASTRSS